jgi:predicted alpha/beta hydrolase family esterase
MQPGAAKSSFEKGKVTMVAVRLRWIVAAILLAAFIAARALGAGVLYAVLLAVPVLFALHAALILVTFAIAWRRSSPAFPERRTGLIALCGVIAAECLAYFALFAVIQPFETLFIDAAKPRPKPGTKPPVLLVHGYVCNRGVWWPLLTKLRSRGIAAEPVNLEPPYASIDSFADQLAGSIDALLSETQSEKLVLVTHSMGGLVARAYLKRYGGERISKIVTLACDHHGTRLAYLGFGRNARQMEPGSAWLCELDKASRSAVPIVTVWSAHDNFVAPQVSGRLDGAREIVLHRLGHLSFVFSRRVLSILLQELS